MWLSGGQHSGSGCMSFSLTTARVACQNLWFSPAVQRSPSTVISRKCAARCLLIHRPVNQLRHFNLITLAGRFSPLSKHERRKTSFSSPPPHPLPHPLLWATWNLTLWFPWCRSSLLHFSVVLCIGWGIYLVWTCPASVGMMRRLVQACRPRTEQMERGLVPYLSVWIQFRIHTGSHCCGDWSIFISDIIW